MNGAIKLEQGLSNLYNDWENRRSYDGVLTIFYKKSKQFIDFHNGVSYDENGYDFYEHLTPLSDLLPGIDFNMPQFITFKEACLFFKILFDKTNNNNNISKLYIPNQHRIENFYIGSLHLYEGFLPCSDIKERYIYSNLPQRYILSKSGAALGTLSSKLGFAPNIEGMVTHNYADYQCLFYNNHGDIYNVHDYQTYNHREIVYGSKPNIDESFCSRIIPIQRYLQEKGIRHKIKLLTTQEALNIYKRAKINK